jgi:hypothetical protein
MKTTIVTTTINVPTFLEGYQANAEKFGHDVNYIVAGDVKSSPVTQAFCDSLPNCQFLSSKKQHEYLKRFPRLDLHLPDNTPGRRNVVMLLAYEQGADVVITLDDDNLATEYDAIGGHSVVGKNSFQWLHGSSTGWLNVCDLLQEKNNTEFYHRGFAPGMKWKPNIIYKYTADAKVVVNAGLWTGDPDTDAITRLERPLVTTGFKPDLYQRIALQPGTWSPFNCQNTALAREVIPAYFLSPYMQRHDDIFAGYVINKIAGYLGDVITFGKPLAFHDRTPHDLWKDLDAERTGMQLTDSFCDTLRDIRLTDSTYHECYGQVIDGLWDWAERHMVLPLVTGMDAWHSAFKELA